MSLFEKIVIMFELDAGSFASDMTAIETKVKNFAQAANAAAQVDFSKMAQMPTALDTVVDILGRMDSNLGKVVGQSDAFNASLGDIKNQMGQVVENTSDIGTQITNTTNITNNLNVSLKDTDNTVISISKNTKQIGDETEKTEKKAGLLKKTLGTAHEAFKGLGSSVFGELKDKLTDVFSVSSMVASGFERINEVANLGNVAEQSRIAVGDLDALGRSARDLGGDVQSTQSDIKNLADNALKAFTQGGSDAAKSFNDLGISLKDKNGELKDTNTLLLDMADATQGLSDAEAKSKLESLGISDPGMISLIRSGKEGILEQVEAQKKLGVATEEQSATAQEYQKAQSSLSDILKVASGELLTLLLPAIITVVEGFKKFTAFCRENKTFATVFFGAIALAVGVYAVAAGAAAIATNAFLWPVLAVIAACAAFAYVLNDVMNFLNGKPSHLGDAINWISEQVKTFGKGWEIVWAKIKELSAPVVTFLKDSFNTFWDIIKEIGAALKDLFSGNFSGFATHMESVFNKIRGYWDSMWNGFKNIVPSIMQWITAKIYELMPDWAKRLLFSSEQREAMDLLLLSKEKPDVQDYEVPSLNKENDQINLEEEIGANGLAELKEQYDAQVAHDVIPASPTADLKTIQTASNAVDYSSSNTIPANDNQTTEIKNDVSLNVNVPVTINNTMDVKEAIEVAAKTAKDIVQRELNKVIANTDNAVAR